MWNCSNFAKICTVMILSRGYGVYSKVHLRLLIYIFQRQRKYGNISWNVESKMQLSMMMVIYAFTWLLWNIWNLHNKGLSTFLAQLASNAENVSIWWRHHVVFWRVVRVIIRHDLWSMMPKNVCTCCRMAEWCLHALRAVSNKKGLYMLFVLLTKC